jgi:hypothetical protein
MYKTGERELGQQIVLLQTLKNERVEKLIKLLTKDSTINKD